MKIKLLAPFLLIISLKGFSQEKYTISGNVTDAVNGEELIGASVWVSELSKGGITNEYGFYSITIPEGDYTLNISYVGYSTSLKELSLIENFTLDEELVPESTALEEVVVASDRKDGNVKSTEMGVNSIDMKEIAQVPILFGEKDVLKTIQLLPGIKANEIGGGFYVRGGSADQNLILLDEAPVYNASHLLGLFSVFNSDAIKDLTIYKGHIPAEYGGRASSVLDIQMNNGNNKKFTASGGYGSIASRLTLEAPIVKDKGSFIISGRRTYLDLFLKLSSDKDVRNTVLYFYDLNAKANYQIGKKDRLFISGYFGRDKFGFGNEFGFDWGNATATARWNHLFNDRLFLNTTALFSDYNYNVDIGGDEGENNGFNIISAIKDVSLKQDFKYYINPSNTLKFGWNGIYHTFVPGEIRPDQNSNLNAAILQEKYAWEAAAYISEEKEISEKLNLNLGLRYSWFGQVGPGDIFTYDADGDVATAENFDDGELVKTYGGLEPRVGLTYLLSDESSFKASYGRNRQYLHLVSNSTSGTPIDLWIPSSNNVKPQIADQYALGYYRNFKDNAFETSAEIYYKDMQNQVDYRTGAELVFNENVESQLLFGKGWSYGAEFYIKKNIGKLTGWLSYTWSKTERKFDGIDNGNPYPASWDRTHDLSLVGIYKLNPKWTFSGTFVYRTGNAVTYPVGKYQIDDEVINLYSTRNADRFPAFHKLDLGVTKLIKKTKRWELSVTYSLYNAYGRKNAFLIDFQEAENDPTRTEAVKLSLFSFYPAASLNFKFK
ncbi:TonB-dependent receptor [Cellulophaga sp. E16_2]|uniref:TonB-dependent receptor n=1 Tax=Cellulophaga sp. E16_2 TaxID=2789297 RepID=UPI001A91AC5D|nr:TonB-dependent receptor [Cellulophaga sp. E16_2]MBO0593510.1 TonB-dependent receptor [Cellulophaga sp. E16_2]